MPLQPSPTNEPFWRLRYRCEVIHQRTTVTCLALEGWLKSEIAPVSVAQGKGKPNLLVEDDEELKKVKLDKFASLRPAFAKDGDLTKFELCSALSDCAA